MSSLKRIQKEYNYFMKDPAEDTSISLVDDMDWFHWQAVIIGPKDTPYEGGMWTLDIDLSNHYPFKPPKIKFLTKIYHPNISSTTGGISLDILSQNWTMALSVPKVVLSILSFLTDPNPDSPMEIEIARLYKTNKTSYDANVRAWTKKYAM